MLKHCHFSYGLELVPFTPKFRFLGNWFRFQTSFPSETVIKHRLFLSQDSILAPDKFGTTTCLSISDRLIAPKFRQQTDHQALMMTSKRCEKTATPLPESLIKEGRFDQIGFVWV